MTDYLARIAGRTVLAVYGIGFVTAVVVMGVKLVSAFKHWWRRVTGW